MCVKQNAHGMSQKHQKSTHCTHVSKQNGREGTNGVLLQGQRTYPVSTQERYIEKQRVLEERQPYHPPGPFLSPTHPRKCSKIQRGREGKVGKAGRQRCCCCSILRKPGRELQAVPCQPHASAQVQAAVGRGRQGIGRQAGKEKGSFSTCLSVCPLKENARLSAGEMPEWWKGTPSSMSSIPPKMDEEGEGEGGREVGEGRWQCKNAAAHLAGRCLPCVVRVNCLVCLPKHCPMSNAGRR